jgi:hypothetical protein
MLRHKNTRERFLSATSPHHSTLKHPDWLIKSD